MTSQADYPILPFDNSNKWEKWLERNHETAKGVWIQLFKKNSGVQSISYAEAVEISLCYGWIDSLVKKYDEKSYIQKFTPRGPKSMWSKINVGHIERLIKEGKMKPAGLKAVESAKADGRWDNAYHSPVSMEMPDDFIKEVNKNIKVKTFFESLNKSNKYAIAFQLHNAKKPETRERRIHKFIEMLKKGGKIILMKYVAFLRGINVGGKIIKMEKLKDVFEAMRFAEIKTLLASGNVIFSSDEIKTDVLAGTIEMALKSKFNSEISVIIRSIDYIQELVNSDPFKKINQDSEERLYVTFLKEKSRKVLTIPYESPQKDFGIISATYNELFVAVTAEGKTTDAMEFLDKKFGKTITTRNWNTVQKICMVK